MAFDGIVLKKVVDELQVLKNGKVNRIYEPNKNELLISIYANGSTYALNIDISANNYRLNLTTNEKPNPFVAPNFCMLLRKYLINSRINKIYTNGLERICFIEFECFNEMNDKIYRTLAIELMGKYSNVILVNSENTIIDALKRFDSESEIITASNSNSKVLNIQDSNTQTSNEKNITNTNSSNIRRNIMPGRKYVFPNSDKQDFLSFTEKDFVDYCMKSDYHTLEALLTSSFTGISKLFIQSCLEELKISNTVSENSLKDIYKYINDILNGNSICKNYKNNYTIFKDNAENNTHINSKAEMRLSNSSDNNVNMNNNANANLQINFFLDDFYFNKAQEDIFKNYRNNLLKIINGTLDKLTRKLDNINSKIEACQNMEKYKVYGELLIANIYRIDTLKTSDDFVELENYYDNNNLVKIPINNELSTSQNAENYFKKYNKQKNTLEIVNAQKKDSEKELDYLESLIYELDNANDLDSVNEIYNEISENILFNDNTNLKSNGKMQNKEVKKETSSIDNYMRMNIDGYTVLIGKNNRQNDYLTMKVANDNDYWFHTKDIHGSHVILRCNGDMPKMETIIKCAKIAAYYSKAKFSSNVPVDYTLVKYVKKPNGAVPGYVIYTNQKTVNVEPTSGIDF